MASIFQKDFISISKISKDKYTFIEGKENLYRRLTVRECARIPDQGGVSVPYKANRGNIAQAWCIWKGIDSWLCLPRRK